MQQQPPIAQGDQGHDQGVDLRPLALVDKLERREHRRRRDQAHTRVPQTPPDVPGQDQRRQAGQQGGQQEGHAPTADKLVERGFDPHQHRRFVRIQLAAAVRKQPVARGHHLLRDQGVTRLVRRPGVTQADAGAQHDQRRQQQPAELPAVAAAGNGAGRARRRGHETLVKKIRLRRVCYGRATGTAGCGSK